MNKEQVKLKDELLAGRSVITPTTGVSMEPLLHDKRKRNATHVLVVPMRGKCCVGDMPITLLPDGRYMLHRIIRVEDVDGETTYVTRGDNCIGCEHFSQKDIVGVVREIYYKNKTVKTTDAAYLRYVKVWMATYPIRRIWMRVRGLPMGIKRRILSRFSHPLD